ncbi:aspartyl/asparaginyl beta-hydroxylase domain-containing protein [Terasakiella pusilla]|uniref:aspartyl/asparaginyl beta-hydroxylase domain-containing protein n=1 Tax=Terasakiella pusilla TaxID=64973 RepID=UPI003AA8BD51
MLPVFNHPFVKLPLHVDIKRLQTEVAALFKLDWLAHPNGFAGNMCLPLIAVNGQYNHDFAIAGQVLPTPALALCPYIKQILAHLNVPISRSRLMMLHPKADVPRHYDAGYHWYRRLRIHIPVFTHPDVIFGCAEQERHMGQGEVWCFDHKNWHWVKNNSPYSRIHLVIDTKGSEDFFSSLLQQETQETEIPYMDDNTSISLEPFFFEVLEPDEMSNLIAIIQTQLEERKDIKSATYLKQLEVDWASAFSKFGHQLKGADTYRNLIAGMVKSVDRTRLNQKAKRAFDTIATMLDLRNGLPEFCKLEDIELNFNA